MFRTQAYKEFDNNVDIYLIVYFKSEEVLLKMSLSKFVFAQKPISFSIEVEFHSLRISNLIRRPSRRRILLASLKTFLLFHLETRTSYWKQHSSMSANPIC